VVFLLTAAVGVLAGPIVAQAQATPLGTVTNYTPTGASHPMGIAGGPDGGLWFTNAGGASIGRIGARGTDVATYSGTGVSNPDGIAVGPDGALWFTNQGSNSIGRITTSGAVTNYTGPGVDQPGGIAAGPDGALWFTNFGNSSIGRISTTGTVTNYTDASISGPVGIAAGPDGALWFTNEGNNSIGRISTAGTVTHYTPHGISQPWGIAAGPDGAMWFTNVSNNSIMRLSTDGVFSQNFTGPGIDEPIGIAAGPDGALWFTNQDNNSIGRISTGANVTVTNYTDPTISLPQAVAVGLDGGMWFTNEGNNSIGRIQPAGYAAAVSTDSGLLGYWRLGESSGTTALDVLGGHDGTYAGGHTFGLPGALQGDPNTAVGLNGTSGHVGLPSLGTEPDWTVEGWTDLTADASKPPPGNNPLYTSKDGVRLIVRPAGVYANDLTTGPSKAIVQETTASNVGSWVYWALVREGPTLTVYRNATAVGSVTLAKPAVASLLDGTIGNRLHGSVDEVAVYDRALAPGDLTAHYELAGYCAGRAATIRGSARADRLAGTRKRNVIIAGAGNDRVRARGGRDLVCGGAGRDRLLGGPGRDRLLGSSGRDRLVGGRGNDRLNPGSGRDHVHAGAGKDRIFSRDSRRDVIDCGPGHDLAIVNGTDRTRRCETVRRPGGHRRQ
jgi:streptogramin lyase